MCRDDTDGDAEISGEEGNAPGLAIDSLPAALDDKLFLFAPYISLLEPATTPPRLAHRSVLLDTLTNFPMRLARRWKGDGGNGNCQVQRRPIYEQTRRRVDLCFPWSRALVKTVQVAATSMATSASDASSEMRGAETAAASLELRSN